jgi:hypothetical protein
MERANYLTHMAEVCRKGATDVLEASPGSDLPRRFLALAEECELEAKAVVLGSVDAWAAGRP